MNTAQQPTPTPAPPTILTITTASPLTGTVNSPFASTLTAVAGTPPFIWTIIGNQPPGPGLTLNSSTGLISGTPNSASSTTRTYLVIDSSTPTAQTAEKAITITIAAPSTAFAAPAPMNEQPPAITPFTLSNGTVNVAYPAIQLEATGGLPPYTWSVTPPLPNGMSLNLLGPGILSGTPLEAQGPTAHRFRVTDSTAPIARTAELTRTLAVRSMLTIDSGEPNDPPLPTGTVGRPYHATLSASGGSGPGTYDWSVVEPQLPAPGLTLLSQAGVIDGIPSTAGSFVRTYRVRDRNGRIAQKPLVLHVHAWLTVDTDDSERPLPPAIAGQPYEAHLSASGGGGDGLYQWSLAARSTQLPAGLTLSSDGTISGTAMTPGPTDIIVVVSDGESTPVSKRLTLAVGP